MHAREDRQQKTDAPEHCNRHEQPSRGVPVAPPVQPLFLRNPSEDAQPKVSLTPPDQKHAAAAPPPLPPLLPPSLQPSASAATPPSLLKALAPLLGGGPVTPKEDGAPQPVQSLRQRADNFASHWARLGAGVPLSDAVRAPYEQGYGRDLSHVRLHDGPTASALTGAVGARAFTVRNHVVFGGGEYAPHTDAGRLMIGHELAHVVQQTGRPPRPPGAALRYSLPGSAVESEADRAASVALRGGRYDIRLGDDEDLAAIHPLVIALIALAFGTGLAVGLDVSGPSYEENTRRAQQDADRWVNCGIISFLPVVGSLTHIIQARSPLERYFSVLMLPLDVLSLGMLWRGAQAGHRAVRLIAVARRPAATITAAEMAQLNGAGIRSIERAAAEQTITQALNEGRAVAVLRGGTNHAEIWVRVGDGYARLQGGVSSTMGNMFRRIPGTGEIVPWTANTIFSSGGMGTVNAFSIVGRPGVNSMLMRESISLFQGARGLQLGALGFAPRSCGITQSLLLQRIGMGSLVPAARMEQYIPITVFGSIARNAPVALVRGRMPYLIVNGQLVVAVSGGLVTYGGGHAMMHLTPPVDLPPTPRSPRPRPQTAARDAGAGTPGMDASLPHGHVYAQSAIMDAMMHGDAGTDMGPMPVTEATSLWRPQVSIPPSADEMGVELGANLPVDAGEEDVPLPILLSLSATLDGPEVDVGGQTPAPPAHTPAPQSHAAVPVAPNIRAGAERMHRMWEAATSSEEGESVLSNAHEYFPFSIAPAQRAEIGRALQAAGFNADEAARALSHL